MNRSENKLIIKKNNQIYDNAVKKFGVSNSSVLWDDQQTQFFRFHELIKFVCLNSGKSILDIGCGNGELYKFLNSLGFRGSYTGYDINEKLIKQAKDRFGKNNFKVIDIMNSHNSQKFDYVIMSGLFNTNAGQSMEWVEDFIKKMFSYSRELLAFNAISTHVTYRDEAMFYLSLEKMLEFCIAKLSPRVTLAHHNLPYNYTVHVFRDVNWRSTNK